MHATAAFGPWAWARATWGGWAMGLVLTVGLAFLADGIGLSGTQSFVAIGMSLGVAYGQRRLIGTATGAWVKATMLGVVLPFVGVDLLSLAGAGGLYSLVASAALGGALAGWLQARLIPSLVVPLRWTALSTAGWCLGASMAFATDTIIRAWAITGWPALVIYLALATGGGLILGSVTFRGFRR